jgi:sulfane dehydrogenase subunit SoxC
MDDPKQSQRRRFLKEGALFGLAAGAMGLTNAKALHVDAAIEPPKPAKPDDAENLQDYKPYGDRSVYETWGRRNDYMEQTKIVPAKKLTPLDDLVGTITPAALHFVANHSIPPNINPKEYRLLIGGMVDRPMTYSLDDLKRLPSVSAIHFLECNANSHPNAQMYHKGKFSAQDLHGRTSCSEWTGVPLSLLLKEAGVQKGANFLVSDGWDSMHYSYDLPMAKAMDDTLVAYGQNGEAIRPEQGYPVRLLAPGFEAPYSVKWLRQIKVVDQPYITKTQQITHSYLRPDLKGKALWFYYQTPPKSLILRPSGGHQLPGPGFYEISGLAWSGWGAIRSVEVSTDGGKTWKEARLQQPVLSMAHTRFNFDWTWDGQETVLQSRCTDDHGIVQLSLEEMSEKWGIMQGKKYWSTPGQSGGGHHFNQIQPWRVERDGSVHNAMFS